MRKGYRRAILFTVLAAVVVLAGLGPERIKSLGRSSVASGPQPARGEDAVSVSQSKDQAVPLALPDRPTLGEPSGSLFGAQSWQPSAPKVAATPPAPVAPPLPYRFAGRVQHDGKLQVFLSKGNTVIPVKEGETLDGNYRVEAIEADRITLLYLPLRSKEFVPVSGPARTAGANVPARPKASVPTIATTPRSAPRTPIGTIPARSVVASAAPLPSIQRKNTETTGPSAQKTESGLARLLWDGPSQVKLGTQFSVALRLTTVQPVRASPMQVRFDPALLESVAVKPGRFFEQGDRNFNYRVNADGSIFIGASTQGSVPASDAELLVLTFRPIKPAPNAELSIASLNLQGTAGRAIAFDSLTAFKTAIIP